MKVDIICVGKIKEDFFRAAAEEYSKRLSKHIKLSIVETADEKAPENLSEKEKNKVKEKEGERIIKALKSDYTVALDLTGEKMTSEKFSQFFKKSAVSGVSSVSFIIGGSMGLCESVLKKSDMKLSFSDMTFPHQLMRVILLEQIYRAFKIIANEPYHK